MQGAEQALLRHVVNLIDMAQNHAACVRRELLPLLLVSRVEVRMDSIAVRLRINGLSTFARDMATRQALAA